MSKRQNFKDAKKITISDLIQKKESFMKKEKQTKYLFVKSLGGQVKIVEPDRELCVEGFEMANSGEVAKSDTHIVYNCVVEPNLMDAELQKELGCVEPTDIVDMLFKPGEITSISGHCMELAGYGGDGIRKIDDDLKN